MIFNKITIYLLAFCLCSSSAAIQAASGINRKSAILVKDKHTGQEGKNGINLNEILKDFDKNYTFVSAHYREDKFEIRLIYANKLGMEGLKTKDLKFKDGSIFYKVVYQTENDPNFEASLVPEGQPLVRQIMFRDNKKFKKYNGWGYAVFAEDGTTAAGDPDATLSTCYACHQLVESRNNVFSYAMETITPNDKIAKNHYTKKGLEKSKALSEKLFKFRTGKFAELDSNQKNLINHKSVEINLMDGEILKLDFSGFMSEISTFLIKKTLGNGKPSVAERRFQNQKLFVYSYVDQDSKECSGTDKLIRYGWGRDGQSRSRIITLKKCYSNPSSVVRQ
ncbi:MAG: cytochrome P460 family protein [Bacteriovorax sp.]|jgi:hypothetical protein